MQVLIGLGGNVGDVLESFRGARSRLSRIGAVASCSAAYRTKPVGPAQREFFNAAVVLSTSRGICDVLRACQQAERAAGRDREGVPRWGPRPLDLDLLLMRGAVVTGPTLVVPHQRFHERSFALVPAAEVAGDWVHPLLGRTVAELAADRLRLEPGAVLGIAEPAHGNRAE